jgi:hypothetical protein
MVTGDVTQKNLHCYYIVNIWPGVLVFGVFYLNSITVSLSVNIKVVCNPR